MRTTRRVVTAVVALLLVGGFGVATAQTADVRQALAPTGKLRLALQLGNPLNAVRDPVTGETKGIAFDLGTELARRIGVPLEPVVYPSVGALLEGGRSGAFDVMHVGFTPERAKEFDFMPVHIEVEFGYLTAGGSPISTIADVDRPGVRIAVQDKSGPQAFLSRTVKNAVLVPAPSNSAALDAVKGGQADVMGSIKPILAELSATWPGSRILDGRPGVDPHAVAMPKGRDAGLAYLRQFMEEAKASGLVKSAIDRAGLRGVLVAPGR